MPVYTYNARAKALHHIRVSKETHPKLNLSERIVLASKATNVPEKTLRRWVIEEVMHPNLTRKDFEERLRKRGRKRLVDPDVEVEIVEWVRRRHAAGYVTSALDIQNHADNMHNLILSPSYISVMMNRNGIASKSTQKRPEQRARPTYDDEIASFRSLYSTFDASKYLCLDETGVWEDTVVRRGYAPRGGNGTSVVTAGHPKRDTVIACIKGDGTRLPLYFITHKRARTRNRVVIEAAIKGVNERLFLEYIDAVLAPANLAGTYLFMDQLSVHKTPRVQAKLVSLGIVPVFFPPKAAADLSPLDNFFFSLFKTNFRRLDRSTPELKQAAARQAYEAVQWTSIRSCWRKCGLLLEQQEQPILVD